MMSTGIVEVNSARLYYELKGEGPPLVLAHAGIADSRMWDEQFDRLAGRYCVLRYDRRGFGRSPMVAGPYSHHNDLRELLCTLGIERVSLIGCSQGAKIITDFALEYPEMVSSLVLVAPALGGFVYAGEAPRQAVEIDLAAEAGDLELVNELELQVWVDGPHRSPEQINSVLRERVREMNRIALATPEDLGVEEALEPPAARRLGEIKAPTLVIAGDLDTPQTLAAADYLAAGIRGVQQLRLSGAAHLPNMELPEEFNRHILEFLP